MSLSGSDDEAAPGEHDPANRTVSSRSGAALGEQDLATSKADLDSDKNSLWRAMGWSLVACCSWGFMLFIMDYTMNGYPNTSDGLMEPDLFSTCALIWISCGLVGLYTRRHLGRAGMLLYIGAYPVATEPTEQGFMDTPLLPESASASSLVAAAAPPDLPWEVAAIGLVGGLGIAAADVFMLQAFRSAPHAAGPLSSIAAGEVIIVFVFCHFAFGMGLRPSSSATSEQKEGTGDRLNGPQWVAVLGLVAGLALIAQQPGGNSQPLSEDGFHYAMAAMVSLSLSVISLRIGAIFDANAAGLRIIRMNVLMVLGIIVLLAALITGSFQRSILPPFAGKNLGLLVLPSLCGGLQVLTAFAVDRAFHYHATTISSAIFACNSVVVLLLNDLVDHHLQAQTSQVQGHRVQGMTLVVASCALVSLGSEAALNEQIAEIPDAGAETNPADAVITSTPSGRASLHPRSSMFLNSTFKLAA